jgi:cytochrome P450
MMLELLQAPELSREISQEIASARIQSDSSSPRFNTKKLLESSLLHSVYAETLRLYTAIMYLRKTRQEMEVGGWSIPKDQELLVCSYSQHMNAQLWNPTGDPNYPSLETFWSHRFVINHESNTDDNVPIDEKTCLGDRPSKPPMQGVGQRWLPFGLGETMCPGRHIVKFEMVLSYAILNSIFEIEVLKPKGWRPEMDMSSFGYGTMAPKSQTPFRIRRRA